MNAANILNVRDRATKISQLRAMAGRALLDGPHQYLVSDLEGPLLDLAVANAVGLKALIHQIDNAVAPFYECALLNECGRLQYQYLPSRMWMQGGPLIDEHRVSVVYMGSYWGADVYEGSRARGDTLLIAAMRAIVRTKSGESVHM